MIRFYLTTIILFINIYEQILAASIQCPILDNDDIQIKSLIIQHSSYYSQTSWISFTKSNNSYQPKVILSFTSMQVKLQTQQFIIRANVINYSWIGFQIQTLTSSVDGKIQVRYAIIYENLLSTTAIQVNSQYFIPNIYHSSDTILYNSIITTDFSSVQVICLIQGYQLKFLSLNDSLLDISLSCSKTSSNKIEILMTYTPIYSQIKVYFQIIQFKYIDLTPIYVDFLSFTQQQSSITQSYRLDQMMIGLSSIRQNSYKKQKNFGISSQNSPTTIQFQDANPGIQVKYLFMIFKQFKCPYNYPFYKMTTNQCLNQCEERQYPIYQNFTCHFCPQYCLICNANGQCLKCDINDHRKLFDKKCIPIDGYFENNQQVASPCHQSCAKCNVQSERCTECTKYTHFHWDVQNTEFQCYQCKQAIPHCRLCLSQFICFQCQSGYQSVLKDLCQINSLKCNQGYYNVNNDCISKCGDSILVSSEQCDDGNLVSQDGCSSLCTVQMGFSCESNILIASNIKCIYVQRLQVQLQYLLKQNNKNIIQVYLWIQQLHLLMYHKISFLHIMKIYSNTKLSNYSTQIIENNNEYNLIVLIQYSKSIHLSTITMAIHPKWCNEPIFLSAQSQNISINIQPSNRLTAENYSTQEYQHSSILYDLFQILNYSYLITFCVGFFMKAHIIAISMIGIVQLLYLSLFPIGFMNLNIANLLHLKNTIDITTITNNNYFLNQDSSLSIKGLKLHSLFLYNINVMIILSIVIPLALKLILFILLRINFEKLSSFRKLFESVEKKCLKQFFIYGILINGYFYGASIAIEILYGVNQLPSTISIISLIIIMIIFIFLFGYFGCLIIRPRIFPQLIQDFNFKPGQKQLNLYSLMIFQRILLGCILVILDFISWVNSIIIFIHLVFIIVVWIKWPFKQKRNNMCIISNSAITIMIQLFFIFYGVTGNMRDDEKSSGLYIPYNIAVLLFIALLYNNILMILSIYSKITQAIKIQSTNSKNKQLTIEMMKIYLQNKQGQSQKYEQLKVQRDEIMKQRINSGLKEQIQSIQRKKYQLQFEQNNKKQQQQNINLQQQKIQKNNSKIFNYQI